MDAAFLRVRCPPMRQPCVRQIASTCPGFLNGPGSVLDQPGEGPLAAVFGDGSRTTPTLPPERRS